jgi:hypothetical protein
MDKLPEKNPKEQETSDKQETQTKTNFEIYCELNPDALECRIYED